MSGAEQACRLPGGARIDRDRPVTFRYGGRTYGGFAGDTLASALLANGVRVVGRSFKYHRPRGIMAAGVEEPNALVQLETARDSRPNLRATEIELYDGLKAAPVNCWPSAGFDVGGVNNLLSRFLSAGFYYKTFMWPDWHLYEGAIRRAAGLGKVPNAADPARYESRYAHCDVLVIGGGLAGLTAALAASASGARVMLVEQDVALGGRLCWDGGEVDGVTGSAWAEHAHALLAGRPDTTVLTRTTAVGYFDHNAVALVERLVGGEGGERKEVAFRFWQVRAKRVVLATGAIERPLVFGGNDRPGVMLATAVRQYLSLYGVCPGRRAVVFANNDDAYETAFRLIDAGAEVAALVDARPVPDAVAGRLRARGVAVHARSTVCGTRGYRGLRAAQVRDAEGRTRWIACDLLAMSGGFNPTVHLFCQAGGTLRFDGAAACLVPDAVGQALDVVGSAGGQDAPDRIVADAHRAGAAAAGSTSPGPAPVVATAPAGHPIEALWVVDGGRGKAFVDFQNDVSAGDIALARRESFVSVEHLKRYTTLGMAPDQGKTSNVNALAIMASLTDRSIEETGTTRYRFPYTPMPLGCFRGTATGALFRPIRRLAAHDRHVAAGARFEDFGGWERPAGYPRPGEGVHDCEQREAALVRAGVGVFDGSPLGKIEVQGPDAGAFLDLVYANTMSTLKVGRCRYGLMLNELGVVIDDGVTARLAEDRFLVGTTGSGADRIAEWLEEWHQCEWPHLDLVIAPVTTAWGVLTISGPHARGVLRRLAPDFPVDAADFPHMTFRTGQVAGMPARVMRVSFTGETSFEINVPARRSGELWDALMAAGSDLGIAPVGIDGWMILRTEKGYLHVGVDTDGTSTALDVGWGHVLKKKSDFIGRRSLLRPADQATDRLQIVGFRALDGDAMLPVGSPVAPAGGEGSDGFVTSSAFSPALRRGVAIGVLKNGRARAGEHVRIVTETGHRPAEIVDPAAFDPAGDRLNG